MGLIPLIELIANGASKVSVAKQLKIGEATIYRILKNNTKQALEF
jgi:transposase